MLKLFTLIIHLNLSPLKKGTIFSIIALTMAFYYKAKNIRNFRTISKNIYNSSKHFFFTVLQPKMSKFSYYARPLKINVVI